MVGGGACKNDTAVTFSCVCDKQRLFSMTAISTGKDGGDRRAENRGSLSARLPDSNTCPRGGND